GAAPACAVRCARPHRAGGAGAAVSGQGWPHGPADLPGRLPAVAGLHFLHRPPLQLRLLAQGLGAIMRKILIVGGTSAMAEACARLWAQRGDALFLAARNEAQLASVVE